MTFYTRQQLERFMRESNGIEGEWEYGKQWETGALHPADVGGAQQVVNMAEDGEPFTHENLCALHGWLGAYLHEDWTGKYRTCDVRVGRYIAPPWRKVRSLMTGFLRDLPSLDSWEAHNRFEKIHPFQDLNGRMGRLLWLYKMVQEKRDPFALPFLHRFYFDTLSHFS